MPDKDYTFVPDLLQEVAPPDKAMTSCVLHKDERFNITLFGFAAGHGEDWRPRVRRRAEQQR